MSQSFPAKQILRCPLCSIGSIPAHVGNGVMVCECCGNQFRVVHAQGKRTGVKLAAIVAGAVKWEAKP